MKRIILVFAVFIVGEYAAPSADKPVDVPLNKLGGNFGLIGKLGVPLGDVVKVQGFVVEGPFKGYEGGPNLRVQRINGQSTQEDIQIRLIPYLEDFGTEHQSGEQPAKLEYGNTYLFEGYETGGFVGVPPEAYRNAGIAIGTTHHYFRHQLAVYKRTKIERIVWSPADFVDRRALIEGKALSHEKKAYIEGNGWKVLIDQVASWPAEYEGKTVEGYGTIKKTGDEYRLENGTTRLVKLEDQRGRHVELRGKAQALNDQWWFEYRGTQLYVENMKDLPGWTSGLWNRPVLITGTLEEDNLPDISQISIKTVPDKKKYFVVRNAQWKPLEVLLSPERVERK
ncbi:MAG: hypothetical protein ACJ8C4_19840 [Gemmataceae bacterium]